MKHEAVLAVPKQVAYFESRNVCAQIPPVVAFYRKFLCVFLLLSFFFVLLSWVAAWLHGNWLQLCIDRCIWSGGRIVCATFFMVIRPHRIFGGFIPTSRGWVSIVCKELITFNAALMSLPVWCDAAQAKADFPPASGSDHFFVAADQEPANLSTCPLLGIKRGWQRKAVVWNNNNNDGYLERLTRTGSERSHILYKYTSKFNA